MLRPRRRPQPFYLAIAGVMVLLFGAPAGCDAGSDGVETSETTVETIDGIEYVRNFGAGTWETTGSVFRVDSLGATRIGDSGGVRAGSEVIFGGVTGVVVDDEGRIHVADDQARTITAFAPDGEFLFESGGDGDGPGEFRYISGLIPIPSGIAALDPVLNRVTTFDPTGEFAGMRRLQRSSTVFESFAAFMIDERGELLDRIASPAPEGTVEHVVVRYAPDGEVLGRASALVAEPSRIRIIDEMYIPAPYSPQISIAFDRRGRVYVSPGDVYRISILSSSGDPVRVIERPLEGRVVGAEDRAKALADLEQIFSYYGAAPPRNPQVPDVFPVIRDLHVDSLGHLWVLLEPDPDAAEMTWSVHDADGVYLGDVSVPHMSVSQIGIDFLAGRTSSAMGEPVAVVMPLER